MGKTPNTRPQKSRARTSTQLSFAGSEFIKPRDQFGGSLLTSNPKVRRPLDTKLPLHVVLRSRTSRLRLPRTYARVNAIVFAVARARGVRIYEFANVGNHLHLLLRVPSRRVWASFVRELTGRVAQLAGDGEAPFWLHRPFTRIVRGWRSAYQSVKEYVELNHLAAEGYISRRETKSLKELRLIWADT